MLCLQGDLGWFDLRVADAQKEALQITNIVVHLSARLVVCAAHPRKRFCLDLKNDTLWPEKMKRVSYHETDNLKTFVEKTQRNSCTICVKIETHIWIENKRQCAAP